VTRGAITVQKTPQDIKHIVTSAVEQVRPTIESNRHRLTINLAPEPAHVCGDEKRLVQILSNLLNNAAKYTPAGGNIELRVEIEADAVIVKVIDDGIGIGPELQPRVFELFSQADRSAARSQGGLGLGLALVKSLVELHDGSVRCDSAGLGHGSCFTISLPRLSASIAPLEEQESASTRDTATPRRILLVDDNIDAADTLALLLRIAGHDVSVEYDARGAIERAGRERPEIFLLDVGLPDMDGIQLARTLRQRPESARSTFVAISGYGQPADRRAALDDGFDHHFVKPVASETLLSVIAQARSAG
jgi:CheY-like chemotaxis protein